MRLRASDQQGFGLIELLMSMTMLNIGILALVAAFQSGAFALKRASAVSTAAAIADIQMERYRAYKGTLAEITKDRRQAYVHMAGDYARRGPDVVPASLSALPPMKQPTQPEATRLDLAQWLVSPKHPLTSRVAVNHIWSIGLGKAT